MKINIDPAAIAQRRMAGNRQKLEQLAQIVLDDSNEYIPKNESTLVTSGHAEGVSDTQALVRWYGPYAHYLYRGELMVDPNTGSAWAKQWVTKVYAGKPLQYSTDKNPNAQKEWFEAAKKKHKGWEKQAQALFGGGG